MDFITVTAKRDGWRRAGRAWHGTKTMERAILTAAEIEQLEGDPMLIVLHGSVDSGGPGEAGEHLEGGAAVGDVPEAPAPDVAEAPEPAPVPEPEPKPTAGGRRKTT